MLSKGLAREENKGLISSDCLGLKETFQWIIGGRDFLVYLFGISLSFCG